jgi:hypothetical protein
MLQTHSSCTLVNLKKYRPRYCYTQQAGHSLEWVEDVNTSSSEKGLAREGRGKHGENRNSNTSKCQNS